MIGDPSMFGAAGAALLKFLGGAARSQIVLLLSVGVWVIAPMWIARYILRRLDL
jgi:hypothetical protein